MPICTYVLTVAEYSIRAFKLSYNGTFTLPIEPRITMKSRLTYLLLDGSFLGGAGPEDAGPSRLGASHRLHVRQRPAGDGAAGELAGESSSGSVSTRAGDPAAAKAALDHPLDLSASTL